MAFQFSAAQLDAFQFALNNATRSGVVRLWLSELTAEMNGLTTEKEEIKEVVKQRKKVLFVKTASDGSVIASDKKQVRKTTEPKLEEDTEEDVIPKVVALPLRAKELPAPSDTALFLLEKIATDTKRLLWTTEDVVSLLRSAIAKNEKEEEELLVEQASLLMF